MNRRGFLSAMLKAGVGAMVLPCAVTYTRNWKRETLWTGNVTLGKFPVFNPDDYVGEWSFITGEIEMIKSPGKEVQWEKGPLICYELVNGVFKRMDENIFA